MSSRARHAFLLGFALLGVAYFAAAVVRPVYGHDASVYLGLARALLAGEGYVFDGIPHTQYPPGQPVLLALCEWLGFGLLWAQRVLALLAVFAAWLCYRWLAPRGAWLATAVALLTLLSVATFRHAIAGLSSEPLFLALSLGLLWLMDARARAGSTGLASVGLALVLAAAAVATRTIGVALVGAAVATLLQRRLGRGGGTTPRPLLFGVIVGGVVAFALWSLWARTHAAPLYEGDSLYSYTAQLRLKDPHRPDLGEASAIDFVVRVPRMLITQLGHVTEAVLNLGWLQTMVGSPLVVGTSVMFLLGIGGSIRGDRAFEGWYAAAFLGILALWPFDEGVRFVQPILPLILLFTWRGARATLEWYARSAPRRRRTAFAIAAAVGLLVWAIEVFVADAMFGRQAVANAATWVAVAVIPWFGPRSPATIRACGRVALAGCLILFTVQGAREGFRVWRSEADPEAAVASMDHLVEAIAWLRDHSPAGSVVMCEQYAAVHLATGLPTVPLPRTVRAEVLVGSVDERDVEWLVVQNTHEFPYYLPVEEDRLAVMQERMAERLRLAHVYPGGRVFRVEAPR